MRPPWPSGSRFRLFAVGDYIAGGAMGAATAVGIGACVSPGMHMAIAMPDGEENVYLDIVKAIEAHRPA